jgi:hypothetical protein
VEVNPRRSVAASRQIGVSHAAPSRHFADRQALLDALAEAGFVRLGGSRSAASPSAQQERSRQKM